MHDLLKVKGVINQLLEKQPRVLVAIDGRCAAGKTTFAETLSKELSCGLVHMDDFFLRPTQRTKERLQIPGENVDHERFMEEVLIPYREGEHIIYRPYDCRTQCLSEPVSIRNARVLIAEGAYSCHKELFPWYDLHIFMDVNPTLQMQRIIARNGAEAAERFKGLWIPLEEAYFEAFQVKEQCELYMNSERTKASTD